MSVIFIIGQLEYHLMMIFHRTLRVFRTLNYRILKVANCAPHSYILGTKGQSLQYLLNELSTLFNSFLSSSACDSFVPFLVILTQVIFLPCRYASSFRRSKLPHLQTFIYVSSLTTHSWLYLLHILQVSARGECLSLIFIVLCTLFLTVLTTPNFNFVFFGSPTQLQVPLGSIFVFFSSSHHFRA